MSVEVFCLMGVTCTGKTTIVDKLLEVSDKEGGWLRAVRVGAEMRKRHPPEFFKGFAAMEETEKEVWEIFDKQYNAALIDPHCQAIIIDGQPRMASQVHQLRRRVAFSHYIMLHADTATLEERARNRSPDPEVVRLSLERIRNDKVQLYDVLCTLFSMDEGTSFYYKQVLSNDNAARTIYDQISFFVN